MVTPDGMPDGMRLFVTMPQIVEAVEITEANRAEVAEWSDLAGVAVGDWVVRGIGGFRVVSPEVFSATFGFVCNAY